MIQIQIQINRIRRAYWLLISFIMRHFIKTHNNRVFCWAYGNNKYSCNPRAITEFILENFPDSYEIFWAFNKDVNTTKLDSRIKIVRKYDLSYIVALYSSKFIITNSRNIINDTLFIKKKSQKYIQTWHGSFGLKRVEKDVEDKLPPKYVKQAQLDSRMCDLMLSNSSNYSELIRRAF